MWVSRTTKGTTPNENSVDSLQHTEVEGLINTELTVEENHKSEEVIRSINYAK